MISSINQKKVLFITTKNLDYIRNVQEINLLKEQAKSCKVIGSSSKYYFLRLTTVYFLLLTTSITEFDTIFVGFAPQLILSFFYWKFKKKYIIIDFFISFYDTLCYDRQKISPKSVFARFLHFLDYRTLSLANRIVCDTTSHGNYFVREFQVPAGKLYTLYLQADASIYYPVPVNKPSHLQNRFVVLYFGSILPLQGADIVLQAMSLLKNNIKIFFYFIGPVKENVRQALCPDSCNIEFISWLSQKQLADYIGQADLCLAGHFSGTIDKAKRTIPGKAYIYQAMQKPMILGDNPANHELFVSNDYTFFVQMGDSKALADTILSCSKSLGS